VYAHHSGDLVLDFERLAVMFKCLLRSPDLKLDYVPFVLPQTIIHQQQPKPLYVLTKEHYVLSDRAIHSDFAFSGRMRTWYAVPVAQTTAQILARACTSR
jgi:hypothetical protein